MLRFHTVTVLRAAYGVLATIALAAPCTASAQGPSTIKPADQVTEVAVGDAMPGAFLLRPAGQGPFPAIIVLGGSEGGDSAARSKAPKFVEQGFAVLGLPYHSPAYGDQAQQIPGLPRSFHDLPLERLKHARDWLRRRPDITRGGIGLYGVSKGAEFALAGASRISGFAAVAAIVPSDVIWEGWGPGTTDGQSSGFSWRGAPLNFVPYIGMGAEMAKFGQPDQTPRLRTPHDSGRHSNPDRARAARIAVDRIRAPVLVAGGDQDTIWASGEMAQAIAERRAGKQLKTVSLIFTDAGHALSGTGQQNADGDYRYSEMDLAAQRIIWPATIAFFREHLNPEKRR